MIFIDMEEGEKEWLKSEQSLSVNRVGMSHQNGWGNVPVVANGIKW